MHQHLLLSCPVQSPPPSLPSKPELRIRVRALSSSSSSSAASGGRELSLLPNALRRRSHPGCSGAGFSLGVDLGNSRTGLALGKGFSPRPLTVLELRGQKLELCLLDIAQKEEVDEFIIGLPKSHTGKETPQSNKVRSIAGRLAVRAAERITAVKKRWINKDVSCISKKSMRGWRVYLQDEHGSSLDALDFMIEMGVKKSARQGQIDAYSALMVLERYFSMSGHGAELVLPKQTELQEKLRKGFHLDTDHLADVELKLID